MRAFTGTLQSAPLCFSSHLVITGSFPGPTVSFSAHLIHSRAFAVFHCFGINSSSIQFEFHILFLIMLLHFSTIMAGLSLTGLAF